MFTQRPATLSDVAAEAGVSPTTVSKFINGKKSFSTAVEARIKIAIEKLDYRQNEIARSMATRQTRVIGLVVLDIANPHFTNIIQGANKCAELDGYRLMVVDLNENPQDAQSVLSSLASRVDGIIASSRIPEEALLELKRTNKPAVLFGQTDAGQSIASSFPSVLIKGYQAAFLLGKHLYENNRRKVIYLAYPKSRWNAERFSGLQDAMPEAAIRIMELEAQTMAAGEHVAATVFSEQDNLDAVVCYNDQIAIGLIHKSRALGIQVPQKIAIAGFDNVPVTRFLTPSLTTVDMRSLLQGEKSMQMLLDILKTGTIAPAQLHLEPLLVVRESTSLL